MGGVKAVKKGKIKVIYKMNNKTNTSKL